MLTETNSIKLQLPTKPPETRGRFLLFALSGTDFAVPAEAVAEVVDAKPITPVPNSPHGLLGIVSSHGEILAVPKLASPAGGDLSLPQQRKKLVILQKCDDQIGLALTADQVFEIVDLSDDSDEVAAIRSRS